MNSPTPQNLLNLSDQELDLPAGTIAMAIRQSEASLGSLPMILWQYGLINLKQLDLILARMEYCDF